MALFGYRGNEFALPVEAVEQIIPSPRVNLLPRLHARFLGVILHEGHVVPLLDLGQMFGLPEEQEGVSASFVVLIFTEFGTLGIPATQVRQIVDRAEGAMEGAKKNELSGRIQRVFVSDAQRYPLFDITALMAFLLE